MIRRPPRSTQSRSSAASDVYKRQIGLSGAGKTSVSKIIAGVLEPTNGEVLVRVGDDWVDMTLPRPDNRGRAKPYIGILYQEYDLYPFRDVLDNLTSSIGC